MDSSMMAVKDFPISLELGNEEVDYVNANAVVEIIS